ncbi:MAG TPA: hypothetical protein VK163_10320 [Opitutaceae bacterium]|nr:hypothetical protein [Opitutaceae bacterium]
MKSIYRRASARCLLVFSLGALLATAHAEDTQPEPVLSFSGNTALWSRYMWRGLRFSNGSVWQSTLTAAHKSGVSLSLWKNYDFDTHRLNEVDCTIDYAFSVEGIACNLGWNHFGVIDGADSDEIYLLAAWTKANWTIACAGYVDITYGDGAYTQVGVTRSFSFGESTTLKITANAGSVWKNSYMGLNARGEEFNDFFAGEIVATLPIVLSPHFTIEPKVGYTFPLSRNARQAISTYGFGTDTHTLYAAVVLNFSL